MYYYYDILLNFQDDGTLYEFYEWEENDELDFVKKIPLFKVSSSILKDLLNIKLNFQKNLRVVLKIKLF